MSKLNIDFPKQNSTNRFPFYVRSEQPHRSEPAYVYLDVETGECWVNNGNEERADISINDNHHRRVFYFKIPGALKASDISNIILSVADKFQQILDGASIEYDNANIVTRLTENATTVLRSLHEEFEQSFNDRPSHTIICADYFPEWVRDDPFPNEVESVYDFAKRILKRDGDNDCYFADDINDVCSIIEELEDFWLDQFITEDLGVTDIVAQFLLDRGRVSISDIEIDDDYPDTNLCDREVIVTFNPVFDIRVQMTEGEHLGSAGCLAYYEGNEVFPEGYTPFLEAAISAAETHIAGKMKENFTMKDAGFNCSINNYSYYFRVNNDSDKTEFVGVIGIPQDYRPMTIVLSTFDTEQSARQYVDLYRTEDYHDFAGLSALLDSFNER